MTPQTLGQHRRFRNKPLFVSVIVSRWHYGSRSSARSFGGNEAGARRLRAPALCQDVPLLQGNEIASIIFSAPQDINQNESTYFFLRG